jgi:hypothetical protein
MSLPAPESSGKSDLHDAAWNAVVVASTHFQQSRRALAHILAAATIHGLRADDLVDASGLTADLIRALLAEAE